MSKAEAFEVNFGENKSIGVNVNFSKGDAIQVPVSINSLDAEKVGKEVGDRIAEKLDETALASVAKESTLLLESQHIQDEIRDIDFSSVETKIDEVKQAVENIDLSPVESKVEEGVNTLSSKIDNIDLSAVENKVQEESAAIQAKIDNIKLPEIDTSALAKQGENQDATNTAIYALLSQFGESVLQEKVTVILNCQENVVWQDYAVSVTFEDGRVQAVPLSENGTCSFSIKIGQNYSVQLPVIGTFIVPQLKTYTAISSAREIYWSYVIMGLFGMDELGRRYSIAQIELLEDKSIIKYAGYDDTLLENYQKTNGTFGCGFIWNIDEFAVTNYSWASTNIAFDTNLLPFVTVQQAVNREFCDGELYTTLIISEGARLNATTPAASFCRGKSIDLKDGIIRRGFLPSSGQFRPLQINQTSINLLYGLLGKTIIDIDSNQFWLSHQTSTTYAIGAYKSTFYSQIFVKNTKAYGGRSTYTPIFYPLY